MKNKLFVSSSLLLAVGIAGCGGGSSSFPQTSTRISPPPTITRVNTGIITVPAALTAKGGSATVQVDVTSTIGVDPATVKINVVNQNKVSLTKGFQTMTSLSSSLNRYAYQFTLPANTSTSVNDVYTVTVTAKDIKGNATNPAFTVGTITVPSTVAPPTISRVNTGITTAPNPLTASGGNATVQVDVTSPVGVDPTTVKINVVNQNNVSIIGGLQTMNSVSATPNRYAYPFAIPANTSTTTSVIYTVTVTAKDTKGNATDPAFTVGTITLPKKS